MTERKDGGSAFPSIHSEWLGNGYSNIPGMTLRDYFAGQALSTLIGLEVLKWTVDEAEKTARFSYEIADAMIAQRQKDGGDKKI